MNSINHTLRSLLCATVVAFSLSFSTITRAADNAGPILASPGDAVGSIAVPAGTTPVQVREAIVKTLAHREWHVQSDADGRIVAYLKHRKNEATVTFVYTATKIDLYCTGWAIDKNTGARIKPEQPVKWLANLRQDLNQFLGLPKGS